MAHILASDANFLLLSVHQQLRAIYLGDTHARIPSALLNRSGKLAKYVTQVSFERGTDENIWTVFPVGAAPEYNQFYMLMKTRGYWVWTYENEVSIGLSGRETMHHLRELPSTMVYHEKIEYRRGVKDDVLEFACMNLIPCVRAFHHQGIVLQNIRPSIFYVSQNQEGKLRFRVACNYAEFERKIRDVMNTWFLAPPQLAGVKKYDKREADLYSAAMVFLFWFARVATPTTKLLLYQKSLHQFLEPMKFENCVRYARACAVYVTDGHFDEEEWNEEKKRYQTLCKELYPI